MEPVVVDESNNIFDQFEVIIDSLSHFRIQVNTIQQQIRQLEKNIKKEMKGLKKVADKNKNKGNKKPSGFANPTKVTKELCEFMNKQEGTQIARTEVTRALISYIKANNLQNKANKKIILPDEKLQFLLGINENQELTYFNLQISTSFLMSHFPARVSVKERYYQEG